MNGEFIGQLMCFHTVPNDIRMKCAMIIEKKHGMDLHFKNKPACHPELSTVKDSALISVLLQYLTSIQLVIQLWTGTTLNVVRVTLTSYVAFHLVLKCSVS